MTQGSNSNIQLKTTLLVITFISILLGAHSRPRYIECGDSHECGLGYCCVIGMGRFSLPRCAPLGEVSDICRVSSNSPRNLTLSYPDGETVPMTNVYFELCPCMESLHCDLDNDEGIFTCQRYVDDFGYNTIDQYE